MGHAQRTRLREIRELAESFGAELYVLRRDVAVQEGLAVQAPQNVRI
jgi:hypothetical protein